MDGSFVKTKELVDALTRAHTEGMAYVFSYVDEMGLIHTTISDDDQLAYFADHLQRLSTEGESEAGHGGRSN